ncbi:FAD:protein FMN transferase [Sphingomonas sp. DG1-23]|uniref:FAD:protein FMN transferase n=1 Tax=Sphingomonas sp. DG1-23 TaxID=3068316 RepID=UPI00273DD6A0|nr:FAD:protein FMN transferase [Sphingomonas sp. DG1-23]MDP5280229.1 FAD:protein FMN transferase [Sphingomonas sp. DG1-23]
MAITTHVERFLAMGTRIELHLFGAVEEAATFEARRAIEAVDDALTIHRPSPATSLNECLMAGREAAVDDPVLFDALVEIEAARESTLGLFDPAADARIAAGWNSVSFDRDNARIRASRPVGFDFGGFGKGFALDRACEKLRSAGVASALLSAGESSIAVVGAHPLGGGWPFAIPHPLQPGHVLVELELCDEALSISSTVGPGTDAPGRAAMIRPADGTVVTGRRSVVAVEQSGARAEMMSTALLVADDTQARRLLEGRQRRCFLFDFSREAAMAVSPVEMSAT